jgi:hypothetical protein
MNAMSPDDIDCGRALRRSEDAQRRGLTDIELHLLAMLYARLQEVVLPELELAIRDRTVKHALPPLKSLAGVYTGAAVMRAMLEGE